MSGAFKGGSMVHEYVHQPLNEEVRSVSGGYVLDREERVGVAGKTALCIAGVGVVDTACCGMGGSRYVMVPGWVVEWRTRADSLGRAVSLVERITDGLERAEVEKAVKGIFGILTAPVQFL